MPRAKKTDKFFHKLPSKSGKWKNKILIGINYNYDALDDVTLEDLIMYLAENNIPLNSIRVPDIMFISKTSSSVKKADISAFPKTLELGGYSTEELVDIIIGQGCKIAPQALSFILQEGFTTLTEKKTVKLCRKTVSEMGFTDDLTPWHRIHNWIKRNGKFCDHELALRLRIVYHDQPVDEELLIANKFQYFRVSNLKGEKSVFRNGMDGFSSCSILREQDPAENDTVVYRLDEEFVYCEK